MSSVEINIDSHLLKAKAFLMSFDNVTHHIYGLTREAFTDIRTRVQDYYDQLHQLWTQPSSRAEIIKVAQTAGQQTITGR